MSTRSTLHKTVFVQATPARAFEVFTAGIDRWWPKSHNLGTTPLKSSIIEGFVGGRWLTTFEDGSEVVVGTRNRVATRGANEVAVGVTEGSNES